MVSAAHPAHRVATSVSPTPSASSPAVPRDGTSNRGRKGIPKPKSERRVAANRLNAQKSTGPRTAAGRAASRFNALRHGLCARVVLLPGEDRRIYEAFAQHFADDLKPRGVIQEMLAGRAAAIAWALRRLPDAAADLAEQGEGRRFARWFHNRGLRNKYDVAFSLEERGGARELPTGRAAWAKRADAELAAAAADGDPAPADRDPAGIVADALAGDEAFAAILKLDEHERRLWSALLSVLRALERRQKLDGRAGDDGEDNDDDGRPGTVDAGEPDSAGRTDEGSTPADADAPAGVAPAGDEPAGTNQEPPEAESVAASHAVDEPEAAVAPEAVDEPETGRLAEPMEATAVVAAAEPVEASEPTPATDAPARNEANVASAPGDRAVVRPSAGPPRGA